jgi:thioredoxin-dependent peroxiredoxin
MAELRTGQHAPQFELPTAEGPPLTLKAFLGKPVVVYFYPQDDTTSCTAEAIDFSRLKPEFHQGRRGGYRYFARQRQEAWQIQGQV